MKNIVKKNYKFVIGLIVGLVISASIVYGAEQVISDKNVSYDNSKSKGTSTNVQGAIDELYEKAKTTNVDISTLPNIVSVYEYNQLGYGGHYSEDFCVTGDEEACKLSNCYKTKEKDSCPVGTIINYKVNDRKIVRFHVLFDMGDTLVLQSQRNIVSPPLWWSYENDEHTNKNGPLTILKELEKETEDWVNVKEQTYEAGKTDFSDKGYFTGCDNYTSCTENTYTMPKRTAKARLITLQEAVALGCKTSSHTCPMFMNNYLADSTQYGAPVNDEKGGNNYGHWTMTADSRSDRGTEAWYITDSGGVSTNTMPYFGARAVVEIDK